ncbi:MAG: serpin family protein [Bacteroidales bacterium]|nr:serpin family protein [Bacteroidales bacterium]MBD5172382.1 serpin family protein [Bacteroidales bacterium]
MFGWQGTEGMPVDFGCDPTGDASHVEGSEEDGKDTVEVSFNRPFIYMVIDGETGVALIMGALLDPDSQPVIVTDTVAEIG